MCAPAWANPLHSCILAKLPQAVSRGKFFTPHFVPVALISKETWFNIGPKCQETGKRRNPSIHIHGAHPFTWGTSIFMGHIHFHGAPIDLLNVLVSPWIQIVIHSWVRGWLDCMLGGWAGHICWGRLFARLGALAAAKFLHHYFHVKVSQDITTHTNSTHFHILISNTLFWHSYLPLMLRCFIGINFPHFLYSENLQVLSAFQNLISLPYANQSRQIIQNLNLRVWHQLFCHSWLF